MGGSPRDEYAPCNGELPQAGDAVRLPPNSQLQGTIGPGSLGKCGSGAHSVSVRNFSK